MNGPIEIRVRDVDDLKLVLCPICGGEAAKKGAAHCGACKGTGDVVIRQTRYYKQTIGAGDGQGPIMRRIV